MRHLLERSLITAGVFIMNNASYLLGYDVGGTKIVVSLGTVDGKILGTRRIENKDTYPDVILPLMVETSRELVKNAGISMNDVRAFGISTPGPADIPNGIMTAPTNQKYWKNVPIRKFLEDQLGMEGFFENDANCGALAEWYYGAGKGCDDFLYLTMSTGIGAGIIASGKLVRGTGFYGGEAGHFVIEQNGRQCNCGMKGCYEAYCGGRAIAQRIQEELKDKPDHPLIALAGGKLEDIDFVTLEKGVRAGDDYSLAIWDEMSRKNAQAFGAFINIFNPKKLILGTFAWACGDLFMDPIKKYLPDYCWKEMLDQCELVPSALRREIGAYAGTAAAIYGLREKGEI